MVISRTHGHKLAAGRTSKPFPDSRPDLEIEGFTLRPEDFEDEIYILRGA
jgi:hypothetical protein